MSINNFSEEKKPKVQFLQARRVLRTLRILQHESRITVKQIANALMPDSDDMEINQQLRSIRRVLEILCEEEFVEKKRTDNSDRYFLAKASHKSNNHVRLTAAETLSFYLLKSYLSVFSGTTLETEIKSLSDKIDLIAPGSFFVDEFFFEQIPGAFEFGSKPKIMLDLIRRIISGDSVEIAYRKYGTADEKTTEVFPYAIFAYEGLLYLSAYHYKSGKTLSFALANIDRITESFNDSYVPEFDADKFRAQRFAVSDGTLVDVKIVVKSEYSAYFLNRKFHPSQKIRNLPDGNLELIMKVPLAPDFIAWAMHWIDAFLSIEPIEFKKAIRSILAKAEKLTM